jgi:hypothetical protein
MPIGDVTVMGGFSICNLRFAIDRTCKLQIANSKSQIPTTALFRAIFKRHSEGEDAARAFRLGERNRGGGKEEDCLAGAADARLPRRLVREKTMS